jgi:hypothetical protein
MRADNAVRGCRDCGRLLSPGDDGTVANHEVGAGSRIPVDTFIQFDITRADKLARDFGDRMKRGWGRLDERGESREVVACGHTSLLQGLDTRSALLDSKTWRSALLG